jgi:DNA-binding CsgD family transcriptional regulator
MGKHDIAAFKKAEAKTTEESIRKWMIEHLCGTQAECAKALNISVMTVSRHVKAIRAEWRPKKPKARRSSSQLATSA